MTVKQFQDTLRKELSLSKENNQIRVKLITKTSEIVLFDEFCHVFDINVHYKRSWRGKVKFNSTGELFARFEIFSSFQIRTEVDSLNNQVISLESLRYNPKHVNSLIANSEYGVTGNRESKKR